uniref:Uncharacterized protein n=1 Tax=Anguilla anguilla TaxID=7936 RepID=A0A0E9XA58_ANGAN
MLLVLFLSFHRNT